ncbi:MAG: class II aldolase/adducin family protein [Methanomicrobiales archaeon]
MNLFSIYGGVSITDKIINKIVETCHYLYKRKLVPGKAGNVSYKFNHAGNFMVAITSSGSSFKTIGTENIIITDLNGKIILGNDKPSSELQMHLAIYDKRPDLNCIIHTHSPITAGFSFSEKKLRWLEGFGEIKKEYVSVVDYYPPGSYDLANYVSKEMENENFVLLKNHGLIAADKNLDEAALLVEFIEETAKTQLVNYILSL